MLTSRGLTISLQNVSLLISIQISGDLLVIGLQKFLAMPCFRSKVVFLGLIVHSMFVVGGMLVTLLFQNHYLLHVHNEIPATAILVRIVLQLTYIVICCFGAGTYSPNAYRGFAREFIKDLEAIRYRSSI